jgi:hypothetical protein
MDYKRLYLEAFKKKINEIDLEIISQLKASRTRNKNFISLSNNIENELREKEVELRTSLTTYFPDLIKSFLQRFQEYESDHLTSFFTFDFPEFSEIYSEAALSKCASELGAYNGCSRAANNFSNSTEFFKAIYTLDKNYNHISLDFDPNESPNDSVLFHDMQKEIFPRYEQELDWQEEALNQILKGNSGGKVKMEESKEKENTDIKPGDILNEDEKLYILHLLKQYIKQGSEIKTTEFLRILHLTTSVIDVAADLSEKLPNYRKVNDGWINFPKNQRILKLENIIANLNRFKLPTLKNTLQQKLKFEIKQK